MAPGDSTLRRLASDPDVATRPDKHPRRYPRRRHPSPPSSLCSRKPRPEPPPPPRVPGTPLQTAKAWTGTPHPPKFENAAFSTPPIRDRSNPWYTPTSIKAHDMADSSPQLSRVEWEVMRTCWKLGRATAPEIARRAPQGSGRQRMSLISDEAGEEQLLQIYSKCISPAASTDC